MCVQYWGLFHYRRILLIVVGSSRLSESLYVFLQLASVETGPIQRQDLLKLFRKIAQQTLACGGLTRPSEKVTSSVMAGFPLGCAEDKEAHDFRRLQSTHIYHNTRVQMSSISCKKAITSQQIVIIQLVPIAHNLALNLTRIDPSHIVLHIAGNQVCRIRHHFRTDSDMTLFYEGDSLEINMVRSKSRLL